MWLCEDSPVAVDVDQTEGDEENSPSLYVTTPYGLFPRPYTNLAVRHEFLWRFYVMGIAVAKCLQVQGSIISNGQ